MSDTHPAALEIERLLRDCQSRRTRRGGPGGQHRNKVETAFTIEHLPTGVIAEANERRSQAENRAEAIQRLRTRLAVQVRREITQETPLSALWRRRARGGRLQASAAHEDFPALLAEALDWLAALDFHASAAAERLEVSTSSLVNLIAKAPEALVKVNEARAARGMPKLRGRD